MLIILLLSNFSLKTAQDASMPESSPARVGEQTRFLLAQLNKQTSVQNEQRTHLAELKEQVLSSIPVNGDTSGDEASSEQKLQQQSSTQLVNGSSAHSTHDSALVEETCNINCELLVSTSAVFSAISAYSVTNV